MEQLDPLYEQAVILAKSKGKLGYSDLQRALGIGWNMADILFSEMERRGVMERIPTEAGGHWELLANVGGNRLAPTQEQR
jgi:DNA segregation ATPase FtsK/SpoIIIE-like protein